MCRHKLPAEVSAAPAPVTAQRVKKKKDVSNRSVATEVKRIGHV